MAFTADSIAVVDIDSHYTEPPDLWVSRAPAKYKDLVPAIRTDDRGRKQWVVNGDVPFGPLGFTVVREDESKVRGTFSLTRFEELDRRSSVSLT
jgi:hypothetical protein